MKLQVGQLAPDFALPDQDGRVHLLSSYRGRFVLLYFYPKDDTPGCTMEACSFQRSISKFENFEVKIFGISSDSEGGHKQFANKYQLSFTLLADKQKEVIETYGVWKKSNFSSKDFEVIMRSSFLINKEGKITKIYENVNPENHVEEVLKDIEFLA